MAAVSEDHGLRRRRAGSLTTPTFSSNPSDVSGSSGSSSTPPNSGRNRHGKFSISVFYSWKLAFSLLFLSRAFSARFNLIHDCDEVFNYWEPLHYLLYGTGLQTWEYSAEFGLRSYLYLLLHACFIRPFLTFFGNGPRKVLAFYFLRLCLGLGSVTTETYFVHSINKVFGRKIATYTLLLLCFSSGCVFSSTAFLPSSFSMYGLTLGSSLTLLGQSQWSVFAMAVFVLLGWPFSVLACSPLVLHSFIVTGFKETFLYGVSGSLIATSASFVADSYYYGKFTLSILNLVLYNVISGESTLYGIESPFFYLKNAFLNFNFSIFFSLALPLLLFFLFLLGKNKRILFLTILISSPLYVWFGFMSRQPHKEERFLFVIYPTICFSTACFLKFFPHLFVHLNMVKKKSYLYKAIKQARSLILWTTITISISRTTALLQFYSAPLQIYRHLPVQFTSNSVCVGSEWYRFPSSFFFPSPNFRLFFLNDGFDGMLPFYFNESSPSSTALSPPYFNDKNKAHPDQFIKDEEKCDFLIEIDLPQTQFRLRNANKEKWKLLHQIPFLDAERSPPLFRAFYIPILSPKRNTFGHYQLFEKRKQKNETQENT